MVCLLEFHDIAALGLVVRRVAVKDCSVPVVLLNERLKILVFDDHVRETAGAFPDEKEEPAQIAALSGKGFAACAEAVPDEPEIIRRALYVAALRLGSQQALELFILRHGEILFRQLQLLVEVVPREFLLPKEFAEYIEIVAGVQRQESKLPNERHGAVFDTEKEVYKIRIEIVVNLHHAGTKLAVQKDGAAAAEHVDHPRVLRGEQIVNEPEQPALAAYPAQKAFLNAITSRYEKSAASLTSICQKDGAAVCRYSSMSLCIPVGSKSVLCTI